MFMFFLRLVAAMATAVAVAGCVTNAPYSGNAARYEELQKQYGGGPHEIYGSPASGNIARPR